MILVDTNVISEPLRAAPEARVIEWLDAQPLGTLYLSVIGYIAAIATVNGMTVATRDKAPFDAAGVSVIDPWLAT